MRSLKLATFLLLAGSISFACGNDETDDDDGGGGSGGSGSGGVGAAPSGGSGTGAGNGMGGNGAGAGEGTGGSHKDCMDVKTATGVPAMIDDFEHGLSWNFADDSDDRIGTWEHGHSLGKNDKHIATPPECGEPTGCGTDGMGGSAGALTPEYLIAKCDASTTDSWCLGGEPTADDPWGNYASIDTPLAPWSPDGVNCYSTDGKFTGIKFKAKSPTKTKIYLKAVDPDVPTSGGGTYIAPVVTLTDAWVEYEVPFAKLKIPDWAEKIGGQAIDPNSLVSISFVIRSVSSGKEDGERIEPYEVHLDDVSFY